MLNKLVSQIWDRCIIELNKEDTIKIIEEQIVFPLFRRYYNKIQRLLIHISIMYFVIILLLVIIILILLFNKKYLV